MRYHGRDGGWAPFSPPAQMPYYWISLGSNRYQVDCHWPDLRQIVELDGWQSHPTRTAFRDDRARDRRLRVAGCSVVHLTWNQLDDQPKAIAADLRVLLENEK